jgi:peptidoglycan-N-acetylglucosamine deacetylase
MHPQVIGRGHRMLMLERLIDYFEGHEDVVFETLGEYVKRWKADNPLERWKAANPLYAGDTSRRA